MIKKSMRVYLMILVSLLSTGIIFAQSIEAPGLSTVFEASPAYPFGRLNPKAPPETAQFAFIIGEFDCDDRILNPQNQKWYKMKAIRRAAFVLNGFAIQDQNWTPILNSSNIRAYDSKNKEWVVTYFKYPKFFSAVWKGKMEGDKIILRKGTGAKESRLTFFNISKDSYSWKAEGIVDGKPKINWEFTCNRRR